jgi:hypothetical protein
MMLVSKHSRKQMKNTAIVVSMVSAQHNGCAGLPGTAKTF